MPFRHEDFRSGRLLAEIGPGEEATVVCTVERVRLRPTRRRNLAIVEAAIRDESGPGVAIWFNQRYLAKNLKPGMRLSLRGERRPTIGAEIVVKSHERAADDGEALHTSGLVPVYPASERVSSRRLVELVADALAHAGDEVDPLPDGVKARRGLPLRRDALHASHQPRDLAEARAAGRRLAYDELHLLQLGLLRRRARFEAEASARPLAAPGRPGGGVRGRPAVRADRRPEPGGRRDRRRPGTRRADAAPAPGRRRLGQDRRRGIRPRARRSRPAARGR